MFYGTLTLTNHTVTGHWSRDDTAYESVRATLQKRDPSLQVLKVGPMRVPLFRVHSIAELDCPCSACHDFS